MYSLTNQTKVTSQLKLQKANGIHETLNKNNLYSDVSQSLTKQNLSWNTDSSGTTTTVTPDFFCNLWPNGLLLHSHFCCSMTQEKRLFYCNRNFKLFFLLFQTSNAVFHSTPSWETGIQTLDRLLLKLYFLLFHWIVSEVLTTRDLPMWIFCGGRQTPLTGKA